MKKLFSLLVAVLIAIAFISCKPEAENNYIEGEFFLYKSTIGFGFNKDGTWYQISGELKNKSSSYTYKKDGNTITCYLSKKTPISTFEYYDSYIIETSSNMKYYRNDGSWENENTNTGGGNSSNSGNTEGTGGVNSPSEESGSYISGTYIVTSYGVKTGFKFTSDGKVYEVSNEKKQYLGEYTMSGNKINVPNLSYDIYYYDSYIVVGMLGLETEVKYYKE